MDTRLPYVDPHLHLGSLRSLGMYPPLGFAVDVHPPPLPTNVSVLDLVCSPYLHGLLVSAGFQGSLNPEHRFEIPILRIDDLLGRSNRSVTPVENWNAVSEKPGASWKLEYLEELVDQAYQMIDRFYDGDCRVSALKSAIAYERDLRFESVSRRDAAAALSSLRAEDGTYASESSGMDARRGRAPQRAEPRGDARVVRDYLFHRILIEANKRRMPLQIHCGMAPFHRGNPAGLEPLFQQYPYVSFVLLHCYPYVDYCSYLARNYANVYLDAAWLVLLGPEVLARTLEQWVSFVPISRIMVSSDATSPEEAYGAWRIMTSVVEQTSSRIGTGVGTSASGFRPSVVECLTRTNAEKLYFGSLTGNV